MSTLGYRVRAFFRNTLQALRYQQPQNAPGTAVLLTLGQSNSANSGEKSAFYLPRLKVWQLNDENDLSYASEPLSLAAGYGASVWPRLADTLLKTGWAERVVIASVGVGATSVSAWRPSGAMWSRVELAMLNLRRLNLMPTHVLWHQGETDASVTSMSSEEYAGHLSAMIRGLGYLGCNAPVFVSKASYANGKLCEKIREGQRRVIQYDLALPGPDTDTLGHMYRYDNLHFNEMGLNAYAHLWYECLAAASNRKG